ncbi:MAG: hypothetical protein N3B18_06950 [Desulfobacterota bacterium]|nr:hypothetical protein [Thermodesulfobacteriota bacterium]
MVLAFIVCCIMLYGGTVQAAGIAVSTAISSMAAQTTPTDGGDEEEPESPCAAAAALGADSAQLETLRVLRDNVLAKSPAGRQIIKIYYAKSDTIVAALEANPALKNAAKAVFDALIPIAGALAGK